MLETLTRESFAACLGSKFRLHFGAADPLEAAGPLEVELISATALSSPRNPHLPQREPFSLVFRGPSRLYLPQKMYRLEHDTLGTLEIFLVPIGVHAEGLQYEAIFN
jgi:uncharacterized protein DUF6916